MTDEERLESLKKQLENQEDNLLLIEERMSVYVLDTDIPLSLVKEYERAKQRTAELERKISIFAPWQSVPTEPTKQTGSPGLLRIMVTGGQNVDSDLSYVAYLTGQQTIVRGHILLSNGASGIDREAARGARQACAAKGLESESRIQVLRPRKAPEPAFDFGNLQIVGKDHAERRNYAVQHCHALIIIGGESGTRAIARQAQIADRPIIPIGVGAREQAAVQLWHSMRDGYTGNLPLRLLSLDDLEQIGPEQRDIEALARAALLIAEKMSVGNVSSELGGISR